MNTRVCLHLFESVYVLISVPVYVCVLGCAYVTGTSVTLGFLTPPLPQLIQVQVLHL